VWLKVLAFLNALVLVLNLIPAFPLDGGQIAQAAIWKLSGDRNLATRVTGRLGQAFAAALGAAGLYLVSKGNSEAIWLPLIALFIYQGAGAAVVQGTVGQRIQRLTVADVMDREPVTIPVEATLLDAQELFFAGRQWPWLPVIDSARHFIGVLRQERVDAELAAGRPALSVVEALEEDIPVRIGESQPLESLLRSEALGRLGGLVAVDGEGTLRGVVTLAQVRQALRPAS
jgi:CBS domain-containing protein